jgi:NADH dehydrogenase
METTLDTAGSRLHAPPTGPHRIVVVGGGAGGLELVTRLGDTLGKTGRAQVTLVDTEATHLWKPLLHEVAAGSIDPYACQLEYLAQARSHHFAFRQGDMLDVDGLNKTLRIACLRDIDGKIILPESIMPYDTLVLAIGSVTNFFDIPGAAEHAMAIDSVAQAERIQRRILATCRRMQASEHAPEDAVVRLVVIGGGATGVELAAELRDTAQVLAAYGLAQPDPQHNVCITLVEAGPRILPLLPEKIAQDTARLLQAHQVKIISGDPVSEVRADAVITRSGHCVASDLTLWAAGIRVSGVLAKAGLPTNLLGQVIVTPTLQSLTHPDIFALGDCASCPWPATGKPVPPRAQAAHQQAALLLTTMKRRLQGRSLPTFTYRDRGVLISIGHQDLIGHLMGRMLSRSVRFHGLVARALYLSLYRRHQIVLHGLLRTALNVLSEWLRRRSSARVKLH